MESLMLQCKVNKTLHGSEGEMQLNVDFKLQQGDFLALMGESGAGKTTLLRILAGLEKADATVYFDRYTWNEGTFRLPPQEREIGFVFQDYALFDNLSVKENLLYIADDEILALQLLEMTHLTNLAHKNVKQLSGGQKQRVALCRAMMNKPKFLLLDEPLAALDANMRRTISHELKKMHIALGATTIMVTHEMQDFYTLANRRIVLEQGSIIEDAKIEHVLGCIQHYHAKVLKVKEEEHGKMIATVALKGLLIEVEVDENVKVSDTIQVSLQGQTL
jgi:molybdate transport system ATP-binding protein